MEKELVVQKLREQGCRITKQRKLLLDIILKEEYSCCKEIYYQASKKDPEIGMATVYRMITALEEIGAVSRKNMYRADYDCDCGMKGACVVRLDDGTECRMSAAEWNRVILEGLRACGYADGRNVSQVLVQTCQKK